MCMCINRSIIEKTTPLFLIFSVFAWEVDWSGIVGSGWVQDLGWWGGEGEGVEYM